MGSRHDAASALRQRLLEEEMIREEEARRMSEEETRGIMRELIGTRAQARGEGQFEGIDPRLSEFLGRFDVDMQILQAQRQAPAPDDVDPFTTLQDIFRADKYQPKYDLPPELAQYVEPAPPEPERPELTPTQDWYLQRVKAWLRLGQDPTRMIGLLAPGTPDLNIIEDAVSRDPDLVARLQQLNPGWQPASVYAKGLEEFVAGRQGELNRILAGAQKAAEAGDFAAAEQLKQQAFDIKGSFSAFAQEAFNYMPDPEQQALYNLATPQARLVGQVAYTARELQDPESEEYRARYQALTGDLTNALQERGIMGARDIFASGKAIETEIQRAGFTRGGARSAEAEAALRAESQEMLTGLAQDLYSQLSDEQAQLFSSASQFLQGYSAELSQAVEPLVEEFIGGSEGVDFNERLQELGLSQAAAEGRLSKQFSEQIQQRLQQQSAQSEAFLSGLGSIGTLIGSVFARRRLGGT